MAYDGIPDIERLNGPDDGYTPRVPIVKESPYAAAWWQTWTIDRIPETAVGWMLAQGWQVVDTYNEEDCGQTFYIMSRQSMNNWAILQTLLNEYTLAFNEGRAANADRYNEVLVSWVEAFNKTSNQLDTMGNVSDGHVGVYLGWLDDLVDGVEQERNNAITEMDDADTELTTQLSQYLVKLNALEALYDPHELTAENLLIDLGVTRRAIINEKYDSALANAFQDLTNRGMYSSYLVTSTRARIERQRTEELQQLEDDLAREQLANEHKLYEQEVALYGMGLDGRVKHNAALMQKANFIIDTRKSLALMVMEARMRRVAGKMDVRDREEKLMAYQLDTRNNLAIGLWNFIERLDEEYPSMESISKLVAGLGDSGGGWVQP